MPQDEYFSQVEWLVAYVASGVVAFPELTCTGDETLSQNQFQASRFSGVVEVYEDVRLFEQGFFNQIRMDKHLELLSADLEAYQAAIVPLPVTESTKRIRFKLAKVTQ